LYFGRHQNTVVYTVYSIAGKLRKQKRDQTKHRCVTTQAHWIDQSQGLSSVVYLARNSTMSLSRGHWSK